MGTRADFYVGQEWIGSLAFDGYRVHEMVEKNAGRDADSRACWAIKIATSEADYRDAVKTLMDLNNDASVPANGWPWPWEDSRTSDRAYIFDGTKTVAYAWGKQIVAGSEDDEDAPDGPEPDAGWPNMKDKQNVTLGQRSGVMILGLKY
jgi:hypothetical protein